MLFILQIVTVFLLGIGLVGCSKNNNGANPDEDVERMSAGSPYPKAGSGKPDKGRAPPRKKNDKSNEPRKLATKNTGKGSASKEKGRTQASKEKPSGKSGGKSLETRTKKQTNSGLAPNSLEPGRKAASKAASNTKVSCQSGVTPAKTARKAPTTQTRGKASVAQETVFENMPNQSMKSTQKLDMEAMLRNEMEAMRKTELTKASNESADPTKAPIPSKVVVVNDDQVFKSFKESEVVPDLFKEPNKFSAVRADRDKVIWTPDMKTFELILANVEPQRRAFKMRCSSNVYFRIDPVYGFIEKNNPVTIRVTVVEPIRTQQVIKIESVQANETLGVEPKASFLSNPTGRDFSEVQIIPSYN